MSPREALVRETREWLVRAESDLRACALLISGGLPTEALFHAQQSAEKAMKAFLTWHEILFNKTHDLAELRKLCVPLVEGANIDLQRVGDLSKYAWRFRYPGAPYTPDREEAEDAMGLASEVLGTITTNLTASFNAEMKNSQA